MSQLSIRQVVLLGIQKLVRYTVGQRVVFLGVSEVATVIRVCLFAARLSGRFLIITLVVEFLWLGVLSPGVGGPQRRST